MKNYEIRVIPKKDVEGQIYWTAFFPTISACIGGGTTAEEAMAEAYENLEVYLDYLKEQKQKLPEEYVENNCSGKIALRIPKTTHKLLSKLSEDEGMSINSLINNAIENYLGKKLYDIEFNEKIEQIRELSLSTNYILRLNSYNQSADVWNNGTRIEYTGDN